MKPLKTALRHTIARQLEDRVRELVERRGLKVVAVTGSVGKTSTKLAIAAVLGQKYRVSTHEGNFNSEIGLPLAVFGLDVPQRLTNPLSWLQLLRRADKQLAGDYPYDVLVLELGVDESGDMARFMRYLQPDIGVVTAIAAVHIEQLGSLDGVAHEKLGLAHGSRAVLLNAENDELMNRTAGLGKPVQTYGVTRGEVRWRDVQRAKDLTLGGTVVLNDGEVKAQTQLVARHSLGALAAAAAVGEELGLTEAQIETGLESIAPFAGRMQVLSGAEGATILDDTYNASPAATVAALQALAELPGRHIAILGSMNELGDYAERGHREVGAAAAKAKLDQLVTIGKNANTYTCAGAAAAGMPADHIHAFDSPYAAGRFVREHMKKGDVILAKGSQNGVFAEEAVALLLADPADRAKLVRQGEQWYRRKREQFADAVTAGRES